LRFNSADSAYLNRTPASTGSQTSWTWSGWVKRSAITNTQDNIYAINNSNRICFSNGDSSQTLFFEVYNGGGADYYIGTSAVYRDVSAWYHIVAVWDSNNATAGDRQRLYVNGIRITAFSSGNSIPSGATSNNWNGTAAHNIGRSPVTANHFNGYLTEIYFIDGQALTPSSFGETDSNTGVWKPKAYSGTYGTNGFFLKFADNSGTTSTTLGADSSGNGNNWTPNNFSVTAGAGNDSLVDSPTAYGTDTGVGGEVRGNYATWNPLDKDDGITSVTNGNLNVVTNGSNGSIKSTIAFPSGKWYWEVTSDTVNSGGTQVVGIIPQSQPPTNNMSDSGKLGYALDVSFSDRKFENGTATSYGTYTQANGAIYMLAFDQAAGKLWYGINGTWLASGDPAAGTNASSSSISTSTVYCAAVSDNTVSGTFTANFGQRAFAYTAPSGFKALCTTNLPTPTIGATSTTQANDYFNVVLWTGNSSASQAITGVGFQPDLVWAKARPANSGQNWVDAVRGATKNIRSNSTDAEATVNTVISFQSDGFTVGDGNGYDINKSGESVVGWCWNAGGSNATNTAGNITSTVRANTTSGFSIVTYTGNGSANQTVGHGLGVAPVFGILKDRDTNSNNSQWQVFHTAAGDKYAYLSTTAAFAGTAEFYPTSGSSTTVTVGRGSPAATTNESGDNFVMYLFTPVAGYSAFGSYTGNGSTDGTFIYTGFRPAYVLIKCSSNSGTEWEIRDDMRLTYNPETELLWANSSSATYATDPYYKSDFLSNGFKLRNTNSASNSSGYTYVYAAFAESPFKYALAR
jgi:hypothetical protein